MAELWSDYTDAIITDVDSSIGGKYGKINVRRFLSNPVKYAAQPNLASDAKKMKDETNKYMDSIIEGIESQRKGFEDSLVKAESITTQLSQNISMQTKQNKLPLIKPKLIERDTTVEEVIYVDTIDNGLIALVEKLSSSATYIADNTTIYREHKIGEWIFGGSKNYILKVYVPQSQIVLVEDSKNEINRLFDAAIDFIKTQPAK